MDWTAYLAAREGPVLVLGNPPWVNRDTLGVLGAHNGRDLPRLDGVRGLDAITGAGNFDVSEYMTLALLRALPPQGSLALLLKRSVAHRLLPRLPELGLDGAVHTIDARSHFGVAVDAVLFLDSVGERPALIAYDSTDPRSNLARSRVERRLEGFADAEREAAAQEAGVDPAALQPLVKVTHNLAPDEEMGAFVISLLFPLLLVVMTLMGAFHPAVDMTAGERERGTAETTLLLPVPRRAVHQGKILAVCATAVLATSLNLLALGLSAGHLFEMLGASVNIEVELPVAAFLRIAPLALLFAFFTSATLTGIAALAKSFKEGQALLGPVQMLFIVPAMSGVMPGLELDPGLAFVPVVNVVIAFRSLLRGEVLPLEYALTALSMLLYAGIAIAFAVRVLSRETIATSGETVPLSRLFTFLCSERATR